MFFSWIRIITEFVWIYDGGSPSQNDSWLVFTFLNLELTNNDWFRDGDSPPIIQTNSGTIRIHEIIISIEMGSDKTLYKTDFRVRIKWNLFRSSTSIVSMDFTESDEKAEKRSKLKSFYDKNQINIHIIKIYAGVISIVLEGSYCTKIIISYWVIMTI